MKNEPLTKMSRVKKGVTWLLAIVVGLIGLVLVYAFTFYPAEYTLRVLRWRDADVYDYQKFPERPFPPSDAPFHFTQAPAEAMVQTLFEMDTAVDDLDTFLAETGTQAFIVIQNDAILYEKYFNGAAQDSIVTSFSVAKSFTSALVGIAIEEGHIQSVSDPITDYLPELLESDPAFQDITIRDLLLMSSGIRYQEFPFVSGDDAKTYYYPDLRDLALYQTEVVGTPGEIFLYNNYHPLLLGLILERATGQPVAEYLAEKIWQPMGAAYAGSWSLDEQGFEKMESGINGRAIDFAKFGRLFLHEGSVNGEQIIPAHWVREATLADTSLPDSYYPDWFHEALPNGFYKYMWWGRQHGGQPDDFAALGNHGQFIYVSPHKNLIIVRHGERYGVESFKWMQLFYDFATQLEPIVE
ncbi:serine hydrolase domain-containing protein [Candidatus Leptofilum sp.]|uniref:serine hydrolase domain-containing protein n=1 Tax=Candidatus Leptofilum sp. TaxID=3241576 RepID=UPI003B59F8A0